MTRTHTEGGGAFCKLALFFRAKKWAGPSTTTSPRSRLSLHLHRSAQERKRQRPEERHKPRFPVPISFVCTFLAAFLVIPFFHFGSFPACSSTIRCFCDEANVSVRERPFDDDDDVPPHSPTSLYPVLPTPNHPEHACKHTRTHQPGRQLGVLAQLRVVECRLPLAVLEPHVGAAGQQLLHQGRVAPVHCPVQEGPALLVLLFDGCVDGICMAAAAPADAAGSSPSSFPPQTSTRQPSHPPSHPPVRRSRRRRLPAACTPVFKQPRECGPMTRHTHAHTRPYPQHTSSTSPLLAKKKASCGSASLPPALPSSSSSSTTLHKDWGP